MLYAIKSNTNNAASPKSDSNQNQSSPNQRDNTQYRIDVQTEGHVTDDNNRHKRDPQGRASKGGRDVRNKGSGSPLDAASAEHGSKQERPEKGVGAGNKEGIGFVDQVGSASGSARKFEGDEEKK